MNKKIWQMVLFVFAFAVLGYCREFFFVHLNVILFEKYYNRISDAPFPEIMNVFRRFSYETLYYSKYVFTVVWVSIFFLVNFFALKKLSASPRLTKFLVYAYAAMFALAASSFVYGYFFNNGIIDDEYTLSRWLMGIAQSPVICLLLLASEKLYNKSFQS
ncbi:MAG: hypothetical protein KF900_14285 [Bacteroidetes bacterium]|nr:hypothetical protein [Bacteroidota bacterium]